MRLTVKCKAGEFGPFELGDVSIDGPYVHGDPWRYQFTAHGLFVKRAKTSVDTFKSLFFPYENLEYVVVEE